MSHKRTGTPIVIRLFPALLMYLLNDLYGMVWYGKILFDK